MTPTAVGFDLDYTLAVPDRDRAAILADAVERAGSPALRERVDREAYLRAHGDHHVAETRVPVFEALLDERAPAMGADADATALARAYREGISEALRPVEGAERLLETLRGRYRVGLLTNGPSVAQREKLAELGFEDAFDAVVITGELGSAKPDPAAFEALCRALDADTGETAYVGDDPEADVAGAADAGLWAVQVLGDRGAPSGDGGGDPGTRPDPRAHATVRRTRLARDLPDVLAGLGD